MVDLLFEQAKWIFSGIGVVALVGFLEWLRRSQNQSTLAAPAPAASSPVATGIPRPVVIDQPHPETLYPFKKVCRLELGSYFDHSSGGWEYRIDLFDIRLEKREYSKVEEPVAILKIGTPMYHGEFVRAEHAPFQFALRASKGGMDYSIFSCSTESSIFWRLTTIHVEHINFAAKTADIVVAGFSERRP
jgi:hypothetical protein